jgi:hypothetical protein
MRRTLSMFSLAMGLYVSVHPQVTVAADADTLQKKEINKFSGVDKILNGLMEAGIPLNDVHSAPLVANDHLVHDTGVKPEVLAAVALPRLKETMTPLAAKHEQTDSARGGIVSARTISKNTATNESIKPAIRTLPKPKTQSPSISESQVAIADIIVSELPPYTQFEFNSDVFIPAHKQGVLFINGNGGYGIESGVDPFNLLLKQSPSNSACALLSNKSYVMMRGVGGNNKSSKPASFLDVNQVEFSELSDDGVVAIFVQVNFMSKEVKESAEGVLVSVVCRLSKKEMQQPKEYNLGSLNAGFGGIFSYQLPHFIEL